MFGLGASEIVVILALALIVFGPQKLPELAKQLARMVGDLRRAADDVKQNFEEATRDPPPPPPPPPPPAAVQALLAASQQQAHAANAQHPPSGYVVAERPTGTSLHDGPLPDGASVHATPHDGVVAAAAVSTASGHSEMAAVSPAAPPDTDAQGTAAPPVAPTHPTTPATPSGSSHG